MRVESLLPARAAREAPRFLVAVVGLAVAGYRGTRLLLSPENLSAWLAALSICF